MQNMRAYKDGRRLVIVLEDASTEMEDYVRNLLMTEIPKVEHLGAPPKMARPQLDTGRMQEIAPVGAGQQRNHAPQKNVSGPQPTAAAKQEPAAPAQATATQETRGTSQLGHDGNRQRVLPKKQLPKFIRNTEQEETSRTADNQQQCQATATSAQQRTSRPASEPVQAAGKPGQPPVSAQQPTEPGHRPEPVGQRDSHDGAKSEKMAYAHSAAHSIPDTNGSIFPVTEGYMPERKQENSNAPDAQKTCMADAAETAPAPAGIAEAADTVLEHLATAETASPTQEANQYPAAVPADTPKAQPVSVKDIYTMSIYDLREFLLKQRNHPGLQSWLAKHHIEFDRFLAVKQTPELRNLALQCIEV